MEIEKSIKNECKRRGLSDRTAETYCYCVAKFLEYISKEIKFIKTCDVKEFIDYLVNKNAAGNTLNVYVNALKFFFEEILRRKVTINVKYSKRPKTLPTFLTKQETVSLIRAIGNPKHRLMIELLYSAGLRLSELINLKVKDLEFESNNGWVRRGKGNKDRRFIIAIALKNRLMDHLAINKLTNEDYLFHGWNEQISRRTIQEILRHAAKKAGISKNVHPHTLRHSFATHLIENGYDVASVQSLLGHASMETTMVYLHMASPNMINVKSPLDNLVIQKV